MISGMFFLVISLFSSKSGEQNSASSGGNVVENHLMTRCDGFIVADAVNECKKLHDVFII